MPTMRAMLAGIVLVLALAVEPAAVHAYLDPASGSIFFQAAVGGLLAAAVTVRLYWRRIAALFTSVGKPTPGRTDEPAEGEPRDRIPEEAIDPTGGDVG